MPNLRQMHTRSRFKAVLGVRFSFKVYTRGLEDMSLRETLKTIEQSEKDSAEKAQEELREWRETAVPTLYRFVLESLGDLVNKEKGPIKPSYHSEARNEELTGPYNIDVLDLAVSKRTISFSPVARFVFGGAIGRVEVFARGRLDLRYVLLRYKNEAGEDHWVIRTEAVSASQRKEPSPLSKQTLEDAIDKLVRA
jgi:hypothetical protein